MKRKVDDRTYLSYLLHFLNVKELKDICRSFQIKGFSKLTKIELIDFILDSLAEEEIKELIQQKELEIISEGINLALKKINGKDRESIDAIKIVNPEKHEIEILFKGMNWTTTSYLSITPENIEDPERDCDCRIGSNMGFCGHFWVGFILSLKESYFKLGDWNLTALPDNFEDTIKKINISSTPTSDGQSMTLIDEGSEGYHLAKYINNRIKVYEGEITDILERQSDFQGNITTYYIITLKDVKFGPQLKKASDFKESDLETIEQLKLRVSDSAYLKEGLKVGNKIMCFGGVSRDNFWGYILKRVTRLEKS